VGDDNTDDLRDMWGLEAVLTDLNSAENSEE
jgi:hypothetical protein